MKGLTSPEEVLQKAARGPNDPEKLLEHINRLDEKMDELESIVDSQGTDVLNLIIFNTAFRTLLLQKELITPEQLKESLLEAANHVQKQMTDMEEEVEESGVDDIAV